MKEDKKVFGDSRFSEVSEALQVLREFEYDARIEAMRLQEIGDPMGTAIKSVVEIYSEEREYLGALLNRIYNLSTEIK